MVATQVASPNTSTKLPITGDFQIGWQFGVLFFRTQVFATQKDIAISVISENLDRNRSVACAHLVSSRSKRRSPLMSAKPTATYSGEPAGKNGRGGHGVTS